MNRRNTKQRQIVLDAVINRCDHPTVEQIHNDVQERDKSISLGTVYRNLAILSEEKKILNIKLSDGDRYDLRTDNHSHFYCEKCKGVYDIESGYDSSLDKKLNNGFKINHHQITYYGICPNCRNK